MPKPKYKLYSVVDTGLQFAEQDLLPLLEMSDEQQAEELDRIAEEYRLMALGYDAVAYRITEGSVKIAEIHGNTILFRDEEEVLKGPCREGLLTEWRHKKIRSKGKKK